MLHYFITAYKKTKLNRVFFFRFSTLLAGPRCATGSASDSRARGPGLGTRSGDTLSFPLPLFQEGQLSVTCENVCT